MNNITYILTDGRRVTFYHKDPIASIITPDNVVQNVPREEAAKVVEQDALNRTGEYKIA